MPWEWSGAKWQAAGEGWSGGVEGRAEVGTWVGGGVVCRQYWDAYRRVTAHAESGLKIWTQKFEEWNTTWEPAQPGFSLASGGTTRQISNVSLKTLSNRPNPNPTKHALAAGRTCFLYPNPIQLLFSKITKMCPNFISYVFSLFVKIEAVRGAAVITTL